MNKIYCIHVLNPENYKLSENLKKYIIYCILSKPVVDLTTELRGTVPLCVWVTWQAMILNKSA